MTPLSEIEQKALIGLVEQQSLFLTGCANRTQAIEAFLQQPASASAFGKTKNDPSAAQMESTLHAAVHALEKDLSGRP